jgi:predicted esterase
VTGIGFRRHGDRSARGQLDPFVPVSTVDQYYQALLSAGVATQELQHAAGHEFTIDSIGASGVKAWFDLY